MVLGMPLKAALVGARAAREPEVLCLHVMRPREVRSLRHGEVLGEVFGLRALLRGR